MSVYEKMLVFITTPAWGYIFIKFMDQVYRRKYRDVCYYFVWFLFCVISIYFKKFRIPWLNSLVIWFLLILIGAFFYNKNNSFVIYNTFFLIFMIFIEIFPTVIISTIKFVNINDILSNDIINFLMGISESLTGLLLYNFIAKLLLKQKIEKIKLFQAIIAILYIFFELYVVSFIVMLVQNNYRKSKFLLIVIGGFFLLNFLQIYLFKFASDAKEYEQRELMLEQQKYLMNVYYQNIDEKYINTQRIMHDIKRHIDMARNYFSDGDSKNANKYLDTIEENIRSIGRTFRFKNKILNLIINEKYITCKSKGIEFNVKVQDIEKLNISDYDMTTILSNLLDNAIEACEEIDVQENRKIELRIHKYNEFLIVSVKNPVESLNYKRDKFISTKKGHLGIGLVNVEDTVKRYDGNFKIEHYNKIFLVKIVFPM